MDGNLASRCGDPSPPPAARGPGADRPPVRRRSTIGHRSDRRHEIVPSPPVGSRRKMVQVPAAPRSAGRAPRMSRRANATWSALRTTRVVVGRSAADRVAVMGLRRMTLAEGFAETAGHPSCPSMGHPGRTHERPLRRAPRAQPLLVPRRGVAPRRPGGARGDARAVRARRHGPPGPLRGGALRDGGRGGGAASGGRRRDRAARPGGPRPRRAGHPRTASLAPRPAHGSAAARAGSAGRGTSRSATPGAGATARTSDGGEGGPPGDRGGAARGASRAARPGRSRVAEPVPARLPGEPRGLQGGPAVHPGAPRRAHGRDHRAVGLSRRGGRATAPCGRSRGSAGGRGALRGAVRRQRRVAVPCRLPPGAPAPPPPRRRLARRGDRAPCRRGRPAHGRHE